ncbi:hypothetical protein [Meiothermus rufus]|uniref:hypothetical protein n=1 Tax=Meiothermus rufus TaxID=604332 RepID=UPI000429BF8D|nr:hypothetical protein [Meiothermus rufus]
MLNLRLFLALALTLFLAACGGGTPPPPSSITLTVEDPANSFDAAAYQVGSGNWQPLTLSGTSTKTGTFSLGGQTKYGVAVRCSGLEVKVIQATASELPNPKLECSSAPATVSFTVNVNVDSSLIAGGDEVCVNGPSCSPAATNVSVTVSTATGNQDFLVTLRASGGFVKVAKVLKGVNVVSGGNAAVSLSTSDQLPPVNLTLPTPPSGYAPLMGALASYLSSSNTGGGTVNASLTSYRPVSGSGGGDRYATVIQTSTSATNASLLSIQVFGSGSPNLNLPAPWPSGSVSVNPQAHPSVSGLSRNDNGLQGYRIYLQIAARIYYTATLSKGWLGTQTSYTLPDLSAPSLLGYTPPTGSGSFGVSAILSNKNLLALDLNNPSAFQAGDYLQEATAQTNNYTVGGSSITLP